MHELLVPRHLRLQRSIGMHQSLTGRSIELTAWDRVVVGIEIEPENVRRECASHPLCVGVEFPSIVESGPDGDEFPDLVDVWKRATGQRVERDDGTVRMRDNDEIRAVLVLHKPADVIREALTDVQRLDVVLEIGLEVS